MAGKFYIFVLFVLITTTKSAQSASHINACVWEPGKTNHVSCNLKTLNENTGILFDEVQGSGISLDIICDDSLFESDLSKDLLDKLVNLSELNITSCKISKISEDIFESLAGLKKLVMKTKNMQSFLEIQPFSMRGLSKLVTLEITESNVRSIPNGFYCPLSSLQLLNFSHNHIHSMENLGFTLPTKCESSLKELTTLDLSNNDIEKIPEYWATSQFRRLQHLYLQHNKISELNSETFAGLNLLKTLDLSYNQLETLPNGLFYGSRELREIYLKSNNLIQMPHLLFHRIEHLQVLDLSQNQLTSRHINNETFAGLVRLIILNLSHNALTRIDTKTFKELYFLETLDLRNNSIGYIDDNAFEPLNNLHTLILAENRMHALSDKLFNGPKLLSKLTLSNNLISCLEPNIFNSSSALKELDLSSNQLQEVPEALKSLTVLKILDLGENRITKFNADAFKNLNQLTGLRLIDNNIENISKNMFANLPHLSVLNLAKNRIQSIEQGSFELNKEIEAIRLDGNFISDINGIFSTLSSLMWLNLAENHLVWFDYAFVPKNLKWLNLKNNFIESLGNYYKLQKEIQIKTLDASNNRLQEIGPMNVPNSIELMFINNNQITKIYPNTFVEKTHLIRVDLYANNLQKLQMHQLRISPSFALTHNDKQPEFYLGGNPFECDCTMQWMQRNNSHRVDQLPKIMDSQNIECIVPNNRGSIIRPMMQLNTNDYLCHYETRCPAFCKCCDNEDCECEIKCPKNCSCYHDQTWTTNIVDCGRQDAQKLPSRIPLEATEIFLDGNNYPELDSGLFQRHYKLFHLYLNNSHIEKIRNRTFFGLRSLKIINLSQNHLQKIEGHEFEMLYNLQELYLQNNKLTYIASKAFLDLKSLENLRIDGNQLTKLNFNEILPSTIFNKRSQMPLALALGKNPWSCQCQFIQEMAEFLVRSDVFVQDFHALYCLENTNKREIDFNTTVSSACGNDYFEGRADFLSSSNGYTSLMIVLLTIVCLLVLIGILLIFREPLYLLMFSNYGARPPCEDTNKQYDAIFLHSEKDVEFIVEHIATKLENRNKKGSNFLLCLQHRDLTENAAYFQLFETICNSRQIVIFLTRSFLQTEWSRFDVKRAICDSLHRNPDNLLIIEDLDGSQDAESCYDFNSCVKIAKVKCIQWTDSRLWEKLRYELQDISFTNGIDYLSKRQRELRSSSHRTSFYCTEMYHERYKHTNGKVIDGMINHQPDQAPPPPYNPEMEEMRIFTTSQRTSNQVQNHHLNHLFSSSHSSQHEKIPRWQPEHIYSSIDSDYADVNPEHLLLPHLTYQPSGLYPISNVFQTTCQNSNFIVDDSNAKPQSTTYVV